MEHRIAFFAVAALLLGPGIALGEPIEANAPPSTSVPVNVGVVPYADVNSHFVSPRNHVSLDAIAGLTWKIDGAAVSGVAGVVRGDVRGAQLAGVSGVIGGDLVGAQLAGVLSATRGAVTGVQMSGVVTYANTVTGAQLGVVNIGGRVKGLQLGVVNVADEVDGAVIGLVNVVRKNGRHDVDLWTSNTAAFSVGTKLGTRRVYSILGMGLQPAREKTAWMPTVGLGGSIPIHERASLNIDALASNVSYGAEFDSDSLLAQLRVTGGYRLFDGLALYAGPVFDTFRSSSGKRLSDISYTGALASFESGMTTVDLGLGFVVGLQAL